MLLESMLSGPRGTAVQWKGTDQKGINVLVLGLLFSAHSTESADALSAYAPGGFRICRFGPLPNANVT